MFKTYYIYLITNLINNKIYIGKTNNPGARWGRHKIVAIGGKEKYSTNFFAIHGAINKYGADNFKFEILEEFDDESESYWFESWWIQYLESFRRSNGYNLNHGGEGGINPTEATRQKLFVAQNKPEMLKLHADLMTKRHQNDPGFLAKINIGNKYALGLVHTEESKMKMSQSHKDNGTNRGEKSACAKLTTIRVLKIRELYDTNIFDQYQLAIKYNVSKSTIYDIISRRTWKHI